MLIKIDQQICPGTPVVEKTLYLPDCPEGVDVSYLGAYRVSGRLVFSVRIPRRLGIVRALIRIQKDGSFKRKDIELEFCGSFFGLDTYSAPISLRRLCGGEEDGLFFYEFLFFREKEILWSDTPNNVALRLVSCSKNRFRLICYRDDFKTPEWLGSKIIYHIYVDRFRRGAGRVSLRPGTVIDEDWESGVPQYGERPGDEVENNVFFGGNLWGIIEKLDYIASLGAGAIYLSPIFEAYSNHKYDTGDYETVDGLFGGDEALDRLIEEAKGRGIKIILDGVFNHTGDDSKYFNKYGRYPGPGAYQSKNSPYYDWYFFKDYPDSYLCWWDIVRLPKLNHENDECRAYFAGPGGIGAKYVRRGVGGWRLDVVDELSDRFLEEFRQSVRNASQEAVIIGEVWERASDKVSYGRRRKYLRGAQLDSVMNYPLRNAIIDFVLYRDGKMLYNILTDIYSSYPRCVCNILMNLLGTHDTERILTVLGDSGTDSMKNEKLATFRLDRQKYTLAVRRLKLASTLQYTVYGTPSLFYGDEVGIEGGRDPFCRMPYPWGREDAELLAHYRRLGEVRAGEQVFHGGDFEILGYGEGFIAYERRRGGERVVVAANSGDAGLSFRLPGRQVDLLAGREFCGRVALGPISAVILKDI